ncbi:MAG: CPBP family intramembrane glutamic endopeptidase [Actinomycetes bacterium]
MESSHEADQVFDSIAGLPAAIGVSASAFLLFALQWTAVGLGVLAVSVAVAWMISRPLGQDMLLVGAGLAIVASTSVKADISWPRFFTIGIVLALAVAMPFVIDRFVYQRDVLRFPWRGGHAWTAWQKGYLLLVPLLAFLILPFYFIRSGAYENWPVINEPSEYARFFVAVNAVGTWDELFFVCICFVLFRRHFPMWLANLLQAVIFVSFLWELGYQRWGPLLTFPFALLQGYIFTKTRSLTYVVIVHLIFDAVVFLAIVHAHDRGFFPFFLY